MKNYLLLCALPIIALCGGLWACSYEDEPDMNHPGKIQVTLTVSSGAMTGITRSTDENTIRDLNFHLCDKTGSVVLHRYQTAATLHFECLPGDYTLYVVANMHEDMCNLSQAQLMAYAVPHKTDYEDLPMTGLLEISILASQGATVQLPTLEVRRQVAKVAYNIAVMPADIELHSVRICSVPKSAGLFVGEDIPSRQDGDFTNTSEVAVSGREASGVCYLLPNPQGTVCTITDQRQKNADNAPAHASYLLIQATRGERVLTYRVYLGENNTDNFDVRRNTFHTLNITIRGDDEVDTRMSGYTVSVWDDLEDGGCNGYCIADSPKHLYVRVESSGDAPALSYTVDVATGDGNALSIGGKNYKDTVYAVSCNNGTNSYSLDYAPAVFSSLNDKLRYAVTVRDEYGFCQKFEFTRTFTNLLRVKVLGGGSVTVSSALHTTDTADSKIILGNSCTLRTAASVGCVFEGWYSDEACTTQVSTSTVYSYTAKSRSQTLYAKFVMAEHTPLDTNGTANCYIAPKKLTRYSFDATVMGKGDWSTNIQPKKLSGTTAKVIWETELHDGYGDVISYAFYEKGRIYFATGSKYGNALIGLFDASGTCIWSWHIWAVDYDPEEHAEIYSSGATFMDRNLGAMSEGLTQRGLYYQWGRKDPFIYPENATSATTPKTTYNLEGYPFEVRGNIGSDYTTLLPGYTIDWATAHPTTVMVRPFKKTGCIDSWLLVTNPNLWGNATSGSIASAKSKKSIYDPCPPGWKVPDRAAWDTSAFKCCDYKLQYGMNMYYNSSNAKTAFYTYNGYLNGENGQWQYQSLASGAYVWTNEPYLTPDNDSSYCLKIANSTFSVSATLGQQYGAAVRCVRE
ncbi:DUF4906 domain-containing protein [Alistipes finegoldii]|uniref:DUF4906 domain-containing protein n=1 Tax=Alistipes finegoldii TaxID=214856 RepID=UPI003AF8FC82